ncbi:hypothetical protein FA13DRAFT_1719397 [Coprinellus micaceus]|uniref:BHLH domain-containing protein n=1 Tax=Coprinellus micaceus TaxID=71717 RepID=A0A4Y7SBV2_COPMI|nr:hypothetical protein FA13DRAFT_1719397 [Coprinellus micaceus]
MKRKKGVGGSIPDRMAWWGDLEMGLGFMRWRGLGFDGPLASTLFLSPPSPPPPSPPRLQPSQGHRLEYLATLAGFISLAAYRLSPAREPSSATPSTNPAQHNRPTQHTASAEQSRSHQPTHSFLPLLPLSPPTQRKMAMTIQEPQTPVSPSSPGATDATALAPSDKATSPTEDTDKTSSKSTTPAGAAATANNSNNVKRKPSRRANTAERRATHNAVERQRRETLNGRFLDLAALLPNLSQIRRPSKSSIVNSSIAYIHASRRHRLIASREVRALTAEAHALRRELNEWRDRANLPRVEEPLRSEGYHVVVGGEMDAMMGEGVEEEWGVDGQGGSYDDEMNGTGGGHPAYVQQQGPGPFVPAHPQAHPQQQQYAPAPHPYAHGGHPAHHAAHPHPHAGHPQHHGHAMGFIEDDGRPVSKGNPFAHNIPRGYGGEAGQGAGALFTPPVSRDGPIVNGGGSVNGGSNGGASPAHSAHSQHSAGGSPSPVVNHARSMSGSPTGFAQSGNGGSRRGGSGSPSYELGPGAGAAGFSPYTHAGPYTHGGAYQQGPGYGGQQGGGAHLMQSGPGMGMQGGMGGMQGPMGMGMGGAQMGMGGGQMGVGVGAGAMGGVFGMML